MTLAPDDLAFMNRLAMSDRLTKPIFGPGHALDLQRIKRALARANSAAAQVDKAFMHQDVLALSGALLDLRTEARTVLALGAKYAQDINRNA